LQLLPYRAQRCTTKSYKRPTVFPAALTNLTCTRRANERASSRRRFPRLVSGLGGGDERPRACEGTKHKALSAARLERRTERAIRRRDTGAQGKRQPVLRSSTGTAGKRSAQARGMRRASVSRQADGAKRNLQQPGRASPVRGEAGRARHRGRGGILALGSWLLALSTWHYAHGTWHVALSSERVAPGAEH
jgi:hypothetical protein